jgi:glycoprotein-N-acetylgalactosamine 3-beta-galactosyltransferase
LLSSSLLYNIIGYTFRVTLKDGYLSGGAGYTLSRETLKSMVSKMRENATFCPIESTSEDVQIGICLAKIGITPGESRDKLGRERFHAFKLEAHWTMTDWWTIAHSNQPVKNVNSIVCLTTFK